MHVTVSGRRARRSLAYAVPALALLGSLAAPPGLGRGPTQPSALPIGASTASAATAVTAAADPRDHAGSEDQAGLGGHADPGDTTSPSPQAPTPHLPHDPAPPRQGTRGEPVPTATLLAELVRRTGPSGVGGLRGARTASGDPRPAGDTAPAPVERSPLRSLATHVPTACVGDGEDGNRVQVVYARDEDQPSRLKEVERVLRSEVRTVDDILAVSAAKTGSGRAVRWVSDGSCGVTVEQAVLPPGTLASGDFDRFRREMAEAGFADPRRKYLTFADANAICGLGDLYLDSSPLDNLNDGPRGADLAQPAAMYARVDSGCWVTGHTSVPTHELGHTLGAVQPDATHGTEHGHCTDEDDEMCYADGSGLPLLHRCLGESLLDCGDDDYFAVTPAPGSWLASHWNLARSSFLTETPALPPVPAPRPLLAARTTQVGHALTVTAAQPDATDHLWSTTLPGGLTRTASSATVTARPTRPGAFTVSVWMPLTTGRAVLASTPVTVVPASTRTTMTVSGTSPARLVGTVRDATSGVGLPGAPYAVRVRWSGAAGSTAYASGVAGTTGGFAVTIPTSRAGLWQVTYAGSLTHAASAAPPALVRVPTRLTLSVRAGRPNRLTATLRTFAGAALPSRTVTVQRLGRDGRTWTRVTSLRTGRSGTASLTQQPGRPTTYRVVFGGDTTTLAPATSGRVGVRS